MRCAPAHDETRTAPRSERDGPIQREAAILSA